mmetsp:Transcript_67785/g.189209  ORF Transcript_67785/g.189209 Transcript_67785/m.189209 type:complete len:386 (+) Transcript_67785:63-1220(+)
MRSLILAAAAASCSLPRAAAVEWEAVQDVCVAKDGDFFLMGPACLPPAGPEGYVQFKPKEIWIHKGVNPNGYLGADAGTLLNLLEADGIVQGASGDHGGEAELGGGKLAYLSQFAQFHSSDDSDDEFTVYQTIAGVTEGNAIDARVVPFSLESGEVFYCVGGKNIVPSSDRCSVGPGMNLSKNTVHNVFAFAVAKPEVADYTYIILRSEFDVGNMGSPAVEANGASVDDIGTTSVEYMTVSGTKATAYISFPSRVVVGNGYVEGPAGSEKTLHVYVSKASSSRYNVDFVVELAGPLTRQNAWFVVPAFKVMPTTRGAAIPVGFPGASPTSVPTAAPSAAPTVAPGTPTAAPTTAEVDANAAERAASLSVLALLLGFLTASPASAR